MSYVITEPNDDCCHWKGLADENGRHVADIAHPDDAPLFAALPELIGACEAYQRAADIQDELFQCKDGRRRAELESLWDQAIDQAATLRRAALAIVKRGAP